MFGLGDVWVWEMFGRNINFDVFTCSGCLFLKCSFDLNLNWFLAECLGSGRYFAQYDFDVFTCGGCLFLKCRE